MMKRLRTFALPLAPSLTLLSMVFCFSALAAQPEAPKAERKWWACSSDAECVITRGFCGEKDCVNKNWLSDYHHYTHEMDKNRDCVPVEQKLSIVPKCARAKCICEKVLGDLPTPPKND